MHCWRNIGAAAKIMAAFALGTLIFAGLGVLVLSRMS
jgi:hypothetical protein